jgi:hypothetical protein
MKRCFVFAAGTFYGLRECPRKEDFVIAADAGYRVCQQLGIVRIFFWEILILWNSRWIFKMSAVPRLKKMIQTPCWP